MTFVVSVYLFVRLDVDNFVPDEREHKCHHPITTEVILIRVIKFCNNMLRVTKILILWLGWVGRETWNAYREYWKQNSHF
jgi:hypothetical protein